MTPKTAKEWLEEADRNFLDAVHRVMAAPLSESPNAMCEREVDWPAFELEVARLAEYARLRHAAKHAATIEAIYSTEPVTIYRGSVPRPGDET